MASEKGKSTSKKRVGIGPLVLFDFFFGGLALIGGIVLLNITPPGGGGAPGFFLVLAITTLLIGLGLVVVGVLLFSRQMWSYQLAFGAHFLVFILQVIGFVTSMTERASNPGGTSNAGGGLCGLVLGGLCAHHAWKLIQQEKEDAAAAAAERRRALKEGRAVEDDEPEIEAEPGWDEGRK